MNPQEQASINPAMQPVKSETKKVNYVLIISILTILAVGGFIFGGIELWQNVQANEEINNLEEKLSSNNDISKQMAENEQPQFNDYFAEAMFIYSWFEDNATLLKYSNTDSEYDGYKLLDLYGIKTIDDMKQRAYKVFDKAFVDAKFDQKLSEGFIKQGDEGVLILDGVVDQTNIYDGYVYHKTTPLDDGSYLYTVHFEDLSNDTGVYNGCKGGDYNFMYEKNPDGTSSFKEFASLIELCKQ